MDSMKGVTPSQPQSHELQEENRKLTALLENVPGGIYCCQNDEEFTLLNTSASFQYLTGYDEEALQSRFQNQFLWLIHPDDRAFVRQTSREQLSTGKEFEMEYRICQNGGSVIWVLDKGRLAVDSRGYETLYCMVMDITTRKFVQEELRLSLERHRVIMDQSTDIIFEWDIQRDSILFSSNWMKKFGYAAADHDPSNWLAQTPRVHKKDLECIQAIFRQMREGKPYCEADFRLLNREDCYIWCRMRATIQFNHEGNPIKAIGVIVDIDVEKRHEQKLLEQAQRDSLTGLFNKVMVKTRVDYHLSSPPSNSMHAMLIIDLDNFKEMNDRFGHLCGDAVLSAVAECLTGLFRASDVVGRIGGDEFLIFLPDIMSREIAAQKARAMLDAFRKLSPWEEKGAFLSCSIGISLFPEDSLDYFGLYRCADWALYHVKNTGRAGYAFYDRQETGMTFPEGGMRLPGT